MKRSPRAQIRISVLGLSPGFCPLPFGTSCPAGIWDSGLCVYTPLMVLSDPTNGASIIDHRRSSLACGSRRQQLSSQLSLCLCLGRCQSLRGVSSLSRRRDSFIGYTHQPRPLQRLERLSAKNADAPILGSPVCTTAYSNAPATMAAAAKSWSNSLMPEGMVMLWISSC